MALQPDTRRMALQPDGVSRSRGRYLYCSALAASALLATTTLNAVGPVLP